MLCEGWSAVEGVECCVRSGVLCEGWSAVGGVWRDVCEGWSAV